jgi:hypothetical protein
MRLRVELRGLTRPRRDRIRASSPRRRRRGLFFLQEDAATDVPLPAMCLSKLGFGLGAGGVTAVAVAWVFALHPLERWCGYHPQRSPRSYRIVPPDERFFIRSSYEKGVGWLRVESRFHDRIPTYVPHDPTLAPRLNRRSPPVDEVARAWLRINRDPPEPPRFSGAGLSQTASGWPALAMRYESRPPRVSSPRPQPVTGGISLVGVLPHQGRLGPGPPALPLQPLWRGLLIDTALYGAIWFGVVLLAPERIRRAFRARRGACPICGYTLGAGCVPGCPECGWNRREST